MRPALRLGSTLASSSWASSLRKTPPCNTWRLLKISRMLGKAYTGRIMYVYLYMYAHSTCVSLCAHTLLHVHLHLHIHTHTHTYMYAYVFVHVYVQVPPEGGNRGFLYPTPVKKLCQTKVSGWTRPSTPWTFSAVVHCWVCYGFSTRISIQWRPEQSLVGRAR